MILNLWHVASSNHMFKSVPQVLSWNKELKEMQQHDIRWNLNFETWELNPKLIEFSI